MTSLNNRIANAKTLDDLCVVVGGLKVAPMGFFLGREFTYKKNGEEASTERVPLETLLTKAVELQKKDKSNTKSRLFSEIILLDKEAICERQNALKDSMWPWLRRVMASIYQLFVNKDKELAYLKDQVVVNDTFNQQLNDYQRAGKLNLVTFKNALSWACGAFVLRKEEIEGVATFPNKRLHFDPELISVIKAYVPIKQFWERQAIEFSTQFRNQQADGSWDSHVEAIVKAFKDGEGMLDVKNMSYKECLKLNKDVLLMLGNFFDSENNRKEFPWIAEKFFKCAIRNGYQMKSEEGQSEGLTNAINELKIINTVLIPEQYDAQGLFSLGLLCEGSRAQEFFTKALAKGLDPNELNDRSNMDAHSVYLKHKRANEQSEKDVKKAAAEGDEDAFAVKELDAKTVGAGFNHLNPETVGLLKALTNVIEENLRDAVIDVRKLNAQEGFKAFVRNFGETSIVLPDHREQILVELKNCLPFRSFWEKNANLIANAIQEAVLTNKKGNAELCSIADLAQTVLSKYDPAKTDLEKANHEQLTILASSLPKNDNSKALVRAWGMMFKQAKQFGFEDKASDALLKIANERFT